MRIWRQAIIWLVFSAFAALQAAPAMANPRLLVDMHSGEVLFAEDAGKPWHPASLTKLMTAFVTFEAVSAGRVSLDTPVIISARALEEPPSKVGLPVDTALTLRDALYLLIVKSANDIAVAIAETVSGSVEDFVFEMNVTAKALGLTATHYVNPNGLHDPGQTTSARDLAILALSIRARHPEYDDMFATEAVRLGGTLLDSQNNLLTDFAGTTGMKTGYVCSSGLNIVATVERSGRDLMAVVLGGSSARERGEETAQLLQQGFAGDLSGQGTIITALANSDEPPMDMRPLICGKQAKAYVTERASVFPYGLEGQPSYLEDDIAPPRVYAASILGRLRDVPLPHPRPLWAPAPAPVVETDTAASDEAVTVPGIPMPRPRPFLRPGM